MEYSQLDEENPRTAQEVSQSVDMLLEITEANQINLTAQNFDHLTVSNNSNSMISYASIVGDESIESKVNSENKGNRRIVVANQTEGRNYSPIELWRSAVKIWKPIVVEKDKSNPNCKCCELGNAKNDK